MSHQGIGSPVRRLEDERFLLGHGHYIADLSYPDMLHAAFARSRYAHARIKSICKPSNAVDRIFVATDIDPKRHIRSVTNMPGHQVADWPILAGSKVHYVGQPIAFALGHSQAEAEDLAELVEVDYDPLPAVVTHKQALGADTVIHEGWANNVTLECSLERGDFEKYLNEAKHVCTREVRMKRQCALPLEGRGTLAVFDRRLGNLVVHCSHQMPFMLLRGLSEVLSLPQRKLRVVSPDVGGGFGLKTSLECETVCVSWAAMKLNRPIRWVQDRYEALVSDACSRDYEAVITAYADDRGKILALEYEVVHNTGAFSSWPWPAGMEGILVLGAVPGVYDIKAVKGRSKSVVSNKPPALTYRGVVGPIAACMREAAIDAVAERLGREPGQVRLLNLIQPEDMPATTVTGASLDSGDYPRSLRRAMDLVDVSSVRRRQMEEAPDGRLIGVGMATFYERTGGGGGPGGFAALGIDLAPGVEPAKAQMTGDGELVIDVGSHSHGQSHETTFAQIATEVLGISTEKVSIRFGDTSYSPGGTGTFASRGAVVTGGAVEAVCRALKEPLKTIGAHLLQCSKEDTTVRDGRVFGPSGSVGFDEIGKAWYFQPENLPPEFSLNGLTAVAGYTAPHGGVFGYSSHVAVVAVEPETGKVNIIDYAVVVDCGRRINPLVVEGQIHGGIVAGIGSALYEESTYDEEGQPLAVTLGDYLVPNAASMPEVKLEFFETPSPHTAFGVKGVGENAINGPPAALLSAVNDALRPLSARVTHTPIRPFRVLAAIEAARAAK